MSDTPRTDAEVLWIPNGPDDVRTVEIDFARTLERELTAAIARAEAAEATVERCKQVCDATAEGWRETQAELDEALAEKAEAERDEAHDRAEKAEAALLRHGYRKSCSIPACNCGDQWNHGGHAVDRLREISEALHIDSPIDMQGKTLLSGVVEAVERLIAAEAERDEALAKLARHETLQREANTDWYVQTVSSHCDRIIWRGRYYNLPIPDVKEKAK